MSSSYHLFSRESLTYYSSILSEHHILPGVRVHASESGDSGASCWVGEDIVMRFKWKVTLFACFYRHVRPKSVLSYLSSFFVVFETHCWTMQPSLVLL